ncbi:hypothetical protein GCM10029978_090960 [Actinoallomurus acanthiterrae]
MSSASRPPTWRPCRTPRSRATGCTPADLNCAGYGRARGDDSAGSPDARWPAAISIGTNPTFEGQERTVEAYALDRDDLDLYGEHVSVDFTARLRDTLKFDSIEALIERMHDDVARAREITAS